MQHRLCIHVVPLRGCCLVAQEWARPGGASSCGAGLGCRRRLTQRWGRAGRPTAAVPSPWCCHTSQYVVAWGAYFTFAARSTLHWRWRRAAAGSKPSFGRSQAVYFRCCRSPCQLGSPAELRCVLGGFAGSLCRLVKALSRRVGAKNRHQAASTPCRAEPSRGARRRRRRRLKQRQRRRSAVGCLCPAAFPAMAELGASQFHGGLFMPSQLQPVTPAN